MPLISFSSKELHSYFPNSWVPQAICTPGRSPKTPRKSSQKYREFETLLRDAFRLRNAQKQAARTKPEDSKGTTKAR
jgi:hypothetical protein